MSGIVGQVVRHIRIGNVLSNDYGRKDIVKILLHLVEL